VSTEDENPLLATLKFTIRTRDFSKATWFYHEVLCLSEVETWDEATDRGAIFSLGEGGLIEVSEIRANSEAFRSEFLDPMKSEKVDVQLRTPDIEPWAKRLDALGWKFEGPVDRPWGARYLYLNDPDGVRIILYDERPSKR